MDVLNHSSTINSLILSTFSPLTPKFSIKTWNGKHRYKFNTPTSKFIKELPFPCYLLFSNSRRLQVSAHFGQPTRRRNSLRKKLMTDQQVHQKNPISIHPSSSENLSYDSVKESAANYDFVNDGVDETCSANESKLKPLRESVLSSKLENWIDQYNKDVDYWGIGPGPIFTVFQDSEGNVKKVLVNEDEILKRSRVSDKVSSRIIYAKRLAREMESGKNVIPRNSSVVKVVVSREDSGFVNNICGVVLHGDFIPKLSRVGSLVFCGLVVFWVARKLISFEKKEVHYTQLEKEMMRRKMRSRKEKEMLEKGSVEVVQEITEPPVVTFERPKIDKEELMKNLIKAKASTDKSALLNSSSSQTSRSNDFDDKIQEIREMARRAREIEVRELSQIDNNEEEEQNVHDELSGEVEAIKLHDEADVNFLNDVSNGGSEQQEGTDETVVKTVPVEAKGEDTEFSSSIASFKNEIVQASSASNVAVARDWSIKDQDSDSTSCLAVTKDAAQSSDTVHNESFTLETNSIKMKPRIIRSVKEAREFLSENRNKSEFDQLLVKTMQDGNSVSRRPSDTDSDRNTSKILDAGNFGPTIFGGTPESKLAPDVSANSTLKPTPNYVDEVDGGEDCQKSSNSSDHEDIGEGTKMGPSVKMKNWMEKNFHEIEPVVKKIGVGFRDNFMVAREKVNQQLDSCTDITQLAPGKDDSEFEWMKDDRLREIVFQVRDNELAGRDPFYLMDAEDKLAFFQGLEKKVEKENDKLSQLHEYLHSNIENLDYGADGISLYDPPVKIVPRWKGPPLEKNPEFLNDFLKQRKALFALNTGTSYPVKKDEENFLHNPTESPTLENAPPSLASTVLKKKMQDKYSKNCKIVIEGSDGSVRSGKKHGKEYWQHTKKWSRGFLESYNAETNPEVKSVMKEIGKDLDRWITEEEIQEAADMMTKERDRNKKFMEKKINKLKREVELFGPQAVVSKYREYGEDKEEDYLWWLDLPHVLCIELYEVQDGQQRIGFYSLEMATDLELEPKPWHVIAFEDAGDCKNLYYIIQAHLDMLGSGHAFVVPRPPKDAFREAKANGFSVTVIRRGELQLNVDQTLEEVEEQITEIGSKIYHDKIMKERSVDMSAIMKGVLGAGGKSSKRKKAKRRLKRPGKK